MSAGVCGKRLGFEEAFGSPSSPGPSAKRSRCSGSPVSAVDLSFATDDKIAVLLSVFPSIDQKVVETVLKTHDDKIDDAMKSLHALCPGPDPPLIESQGFALMADSDGHTAEGHTNTQTCEPTVAYISNGNLVCEPREPQEKPSWVDIFVKEMMSVSDWDDIRGRASMILEAFEREILSRSALSEDVLHTHHQEVASLKEQLHCLLRDNQILKRAVAIQHERNSENVEKLKEVDHLKHALRQYHEQIQTLEMNNYALKIHLQRAHEANAIPSRFHPDVF